MPADWKSVLSNAKCTVHGWDLAGHDAQRCVAIELIKAFDQEDTRVLIEPTLARGTTNPPDVVVIDELAGVHVVEVKGVSLNNIREIQAGGNIVFLYGGKPKPKNPIKQVRDQMFDIKNAAEKAAFPNLSIPFQFWVAFPNITRKQWHDRWGEECFCPDEFLFRDQLEAPTLSTLFRLAAHAFRKPPYLKENIDFVLHAFGDSAVVYPTKRPSRSVKEGTLGEDFDEKANAYKRLSEEQQRLSEQKWDGAPRLVRGVAGSGKTVVLANNLARRIERATRTERTLLGEPKFLVVCFNRTLVQFIQEKLEIAYRKRTGDDVPTNIVQVMTFHQMLWRKVRCGLWEYKDPTHEDRESQASEYNDALSDARRRTPDLVDRESYDAIYVDEGQDFCEGELQLLVKLCRTDNNSEPNIYVFYDDAQNLYANQRPNWSSVGIKVTGTRSCVMTRCFRNTRQIIEPAFNVLAGSFATQQVPTRGFADIPGLAVRELIKPFQQAWTVCFANREGDLPRYTRLENVAAEDERILERLHWLIDEQQVRPEDIQVLAHTKSRVRELAMIAKNSSLALDDVHVSIDKRDARMVQPGQLTFSTIASAKGYDAYCILLASGCSLKDDVMGRASFYVASTRAREYLEVFSHEDTALMQEFKQAIATCRATRLQ